MPKGSTKKSPSVTKVPKVKKTKNSITRGHDSDQIIHGKRKRHPTQRLVESSVLTKQTQRTAKPKAKAVKKAGKGAVTPVKHSADKRGRSPAKGSGSKQGSGKKSARSRSTSKKSKKSKEEGEEKSHEHEAHDEEHEDTEAETKDGEKENSATKKKKLNRTRTMTDTIASGKAALKGSRVKGKTRSGSKGKKKAK